MSITSLNQLSNFYQQPLLSLIKGTESERIISQKNVHQWNVNEYVVYLIKEHNSLKYKTINGNKKEIYCNDIDISEEDLEQEIAYLKTCKVMVEENGAARFYNTYHTWRIPTRELDKVEEVTPKNDFIKSFSNYQSWKYDPTIKLSLNQGNEDLVWNVFQRITKECSFHHFQEATIPSLRCHPGTVALIDKIKKEAFNNPQYILCLIRDFKVRVIDSELFQKELTIEKNNLASESFSDRLEQESFLSKNEKIVCSVASGMLYLSKKVIVTTANSVSRFCGNGVLGTMAGAYVGLFLTGGAIAGASTGMLIGGAQRVSSYFFPYSLPDFLQKKQKALEERASFVSVEKPLLIEIEPISEPSVIDPRVRVSRFTWAVTVITTEGISRSHAAIIVEGINEGFFNREACLSIGAEIEIGEKFIYLADFNPPVQACLLSPSELKYLKRTEIWMRTSDKVQEMIRNIGEELLRKNRRWFNIRGRNAIFPNLTTTEDKWVTFFAEPGDNCYTFNREHLKTLDIDPGSSYIDFIAAMARFYAKDPENYKSLPIQVTI